ncbi:hypothetical protein GCK32_004095 [Trichostrongylus colubriformis]|uniref:CDT1 Geminin-binding domain-containing protein n=1 Tax=Trichostrongylus colubriformis TaxID=6319 RepID=A0AAN8IDE5_TRICO
MSCRSTRARAAKIVLDDTLPQTRKITDVFKVTRGRGKPQKKLHDEEHRVETKQARAPRLPKQESPEDDCSSTKAASICSPPKRAKKCPAHSAPVGVSKMLFSANDSESNSLKKEVVAEVNRDEATPCTEQEPKVESSVSEAVKSEVSTEITTCVVQSPSKDTLISEAEELSQKLASKAVQMKARARIRNVAELQAMLAEKGAIRSIHEQAQRIKSKQVEEHAKLLKSPVKSVPKGSARGQVTTRTKPNTPHKHIEPSTSAVPEFILPTHKTPAKESLDEFELKETRHIFEYGKASRLINEVKKNSSLPLPRQYDRLHECFQSCDRVVSIYTNQGRRCAVLEIQKNVEKNTHLSFTRKHLAQIIHVYPTSYDVRLDKRWNAFGGTESHGKMELIMTVNLVDDLTGYMLPDTPVKFDDKPLPTVTPSKLISPRKKVVTVLPRDPVLDAKPRLEGWRMVCRSHVFRHKLVEIAKKFHQRFLERLGLNMKDNELLRLRRFHPNFDLEQECGEIEQADLPEVDHDASERHLEMKDYLATVDTTVPLPKAVTAALEDLKSPVKKLISSNSAVPLSPRQFAEKQASKPKGAMSLLERIRAKEAERKAAEKLRDPVIEKKIELLERILHGLLRCITTYFAFKKVRSLELRTLSEQVMRSQSSMNRDALMEHLTILCEVASNYVAFAEFGGKKYLQMKENNYAAIEKVVQDEMARLQTSAGSVAQPMQGVSVASAAKKTAVRALF